MTVPLTNSSSLGMPSGVGCRKKTSSTRELCAASDEVSPRVRSLESPRASVRAQRCGAFAGGLERDVHVQAGLCEANLAEEARLGGVKVARTGSRGARRDRERVVQALVRQVVEPLRVAKRTPGHGRWSSSVPTRAPPYAVNGLPCLKVLPDISIVNARPQNGAFFSKGSTRAARERASAAGGPAQARPDIDHLRFSPHVQAADLAAAGELINIIVT